MNTDVFLIGSGQTRFGEWWEKGIRDLMYEAIDGALESAPCTALDIDTVIVANMIAERTNAQAHLGALASSLLPHRPPALRVESACASGAVALHTACALLESGRAKTVLVLGVEKMTDVPPAEVSTALMGAADSEKDAPCGLTFPGIFGLVAQRYMFEYGLTREQLNTVSAAHHTTAMQWQILSRSSVRRSPQRRSPRAPRWQTRSACSTAPPSATVRQPASSRRHSRVI